MAFDIKAVIGLAAAAAAVGLVFAFTRKGNGATANGDAAFDLDQGSPGFEPQPDGGLLYSPPAQDNKYIPEIPGYVPGEPEYTNGTTIVYTPEYTPEPQPIAPVPVTAEIGTPENPLRAEIPGELIPTASWYGLRDIQNVLGWTLEQYQEQIAVIRQLPSDQRTAEQQYAGGYSATMDDAVATINFKDQVKNLGGSYVGGVLTVPPGYTGSVTQFAQDVRASLG